jgi:hypothetical protein
MQVLILRECQCKIESTTEDGAKMVLLNCIRVGFLPRSLCRPAQPTQSIYPDSCFFTPVAGYEANASRNGKPSVSECPKSTAGVQDWGAGRSRSRKDQPRLGLEHAGEARWAVANLTGLAYGYSTLLLAVCTTLVPCSEG